MSDDFKTCVMIGLGYIGLPTAAVIARTGIKVLGVDVNRKIVDAINAGLCPIEEKGLPELVALDMEFHALVGRASHCVTAQRGSRLEGGLHGKGEQFQRPQLFGREGKHGSRYIQDHIHERTDLFAVEFHGVGAGASIGLPVDLSGIIPRQVDAVVLEIETATGSAAHELARMTSPPLLAEGQF